MRYLTLLTVVAVAATSFTFGRAAAEPAPDTEQGAAPLLFVQSASSGSFDVADDGTVTVTLDDVGDTVWFTDRPDRQGGVFPTERFVTDEWHAFGDVPPNAAIVIDDPDVADHHDTLLATLTAPSYTDGALTYTVTPLDERGDAAAGLSRFAAHADDELVGAFGSVSVFIDSIFRKQYKVHNRSNRDVCLMYAAWGGDLMSFVELTAARGVRMGIDEWNDHIEDDTSDMAVKHGLFCDQWIEPGHTEMWQTGGLILMQPVVCLFWYAPGSVGTQDDAAAGYQNLDGLEGPLSCDHHSHSGTRYIIEPDGSEVTKRDNF